MLENWDWLPPVFAGQSIYSPYIRYLLPIAGYHPEARFRGINPDEAARVNTSWTREHHLEMWEL